MDWTGIEAPSLDDFELLSREAFATLPAEFRALVDGIVFVVQDFPDDDIIREMELESEFEILGLFQGPNLATREGGVAASSLTMVILYRRPILDYWAEHYEKLGDIVRHVLVHEIGHHFDLSDDDMEAIEEVAD